MESDSAEVPLPPPSSSTTVTAAGSSPFATRSAMGIFRSCQRPSFS